MEEEKTEVKVSEDVIEYLRKGPTDILSNNLDNILRDFMDQLKKYPSELKNSGIEQIYIDASFIGFTMGIANVLNVNSHFNKEFKS